jgi:hypothetical protein
MEYPTLNVKPKYRQVVDTFLGYNHNLRIGDGEFYDMKNMTSDNYPVLAPRKNRSDVTHAKTQGIIAKEKFCFVSNGAFCMTSDVDIDSDGEIAVVPVPLSGKGTMELVSMGSYVIIMPDRKYVNTVPVGKDENGDDEYEWGSIDEVHNTTGDVEFTLCTLAGDAYYENGKEPPKGNTSPENPKNGDMWIDTSAVPNVLKKYSEYNSQWVSIPTTYIKIQSTGIGKGLNKYDGVTLSGIKADGVDGLNGSHVLWDCKDDEIIIMGILDKATTQTVEQGNITISRKMPDMDFIIECNNRLWGCKYGKNENGDIVNEIYASKLGDFKNWNCQMQISMDSWQGSCGSDGPFTGAINYLGSPMFFKDNCLHKVYGENPPFRLQNTICRGVQKGSHKSLAIVNETLFYKSGSAVCAFDGSLPVEVSSALGDVHYTDAVACSYRNKYYISMKSDDGYALFVYDTARGLWHKEDDLHVVEFAVYKNEVYAVNGDENGYTHALLGSVAIVQDWKEKSFPWMVETGIIGMSQPDMKYISKLQIRMSLDVGTKVSVSIQYDSVGDWEQVFQMSMTSLRSFAIPICPRRCDHFRIRIEGEGQCKVYSITKTIEQGSDFS